MFVSCNSSITLPKPALFLQATFPLYDNHVAVVASQRHTSSVYFYNQKGQLLQTHQIADSTVLHQNVKCLSSQELVILTPSTKSIHKINFKHGSMETEQFESSTTSHYQTHLYTFPENSKICILEKFETSGNVSALVTYIAGYNFKVISRHTIEDISDYTHEQLDQSQHLIFLNQKIGTNNVLDALIVARSGVTRFSPTLPEKINIRKVLKLSEKEYLFINDSDLETNRAFVYNLQAQTIRAFGKKMGIIPELFFEIHISGKYLYVLTYGTFTREEAEKGSDLLIIDLKEQEPMDLKSKCFAKLGHLTSMSREGEAKIVQVVTNNGMLRDVKSLTVSVKRYVSRIELFIFQLKKLGMSKDQISSTITVFDYEN